MLRLRPHAVIVFALAGAGCLTPSPRHVGSPDTQLESLLVDLRDTRGGTFERDRAVGSDEAGREAMVSREVSALALRFPRHVPVLVANASLAFERRDFIGAQKYLDQALQLDPVHAEATLLRVRIAAEAGNLPYARRKLREQLALAPDHAELREAHSGVLYLLGEYEEALAELDVADRLRGDEAETWKTNYHRGLIAEAQGDLDEAQEFYRLSCEENPEFELAARRHRWLEGRPEAEGEPEPQPEP